ncbi:MAG TPA: hypothetical protein VNE63_22760, partial [Candidatus Acidoferrales bacterium]|nr:hypothetical protein [Candidatus Acidoferrales bacterium]
AERKYADAEALGLGDVNMIQAGGGRGDGPQVGRRGEDFVVDVVAQSNPQNGCLRHCGKKAGTVEIGPDHPTGFLEAFGCWLGEVRGFGD